MSEKIKAVAHAALAQIDGLVTSWLPDAKREGGDYVAINPTRADKSKGSFRITRSNGKWHDAATGEGGGDLVSLYAYLHGTTQGEAARAIAPLVGLNDLYSDSWTPQQVKAKQAELTAKAKAHQAKAEAEEKAARAKAADTAAQIWERSIATSEHAYLSKKGVPSHGLKACSITIGNIKQGALIIPLYKGDKLTTIQGIDDKGNKQLLSGGEVKGAYFVIEGVQPAIVCEGYATAASVHRVTGRKVYAAINAHNILEVVKACPDIQLVAADNDSEKTNTGEQVAKQTGLGYSMPPEAGDWNDYEQKYGLEAARSMFKLCTRLNPSEVLNKLLAGRGDSFIQVPEAIKQTVIGKLACRAAYTLEMPLGSTLLILLAGASASVATSYATAFRSGTRVALGIYATAEQPPSTQKSRVLSIGLEAHQKGLSAHNKAIFEHNSNAADKGEQLPFSFRPLSDATSAAIDKELSNKDSGRFTIASAEQAAFQTLFPENGSYSNSNGLLLNGWAGELVASGRAGRDSFTGLAWGTVILYAQKGSIQRVLNASQGQGLTERFMFASEPSYLGKRTFDKGYLTDADREEFNLAVQSCLKSYTDKVKAAGEGAKPETSLDCLHLITPCAEGYQLIEEKRKELEPFLGELMERGEQTYLGWLGKFETHTLKIAGVLHVFDCLGEGAKEALPTIPLHRVQTALELVLNVGAHIRRIIQDSGEAGKSAEAETLLSLVSEGKGRLKKSAVPMKAKNRAPFKQLGSKAYSMAKQSLDELINLGLLEVDSEGFINVT